MSREIVLPGGDTLNLFDSTFSSSYIEALLTWYSRDNLLDNAYFVGGGSQQGGGQFPINLEGKTEYTLALSYGPNRWAGDRVVVKLTPNGLECAPSAGNSDGYIQQRMELSALPPVGSVMTISILADSVLYSGTFVRLASGVDYNLYTFPNGLVGIEHLQAGTFRVTIRFTGSVVLQAAKLEPGPNQTLAHQDTAGNWILNDPPPDYQQELARCQRYYIPSTTTGTTITVVNGLGSVVKIPCAMRANPTPIDAGNRFYGEDGNWHAVTVKSAFWQPTYVYVKYDIGTAGWTLGKTYLLEHQPGLDANL